MINRIITGLIAGSLLIAVLLIGGTLFTVAIFAILLMSMYELFKVTGINKKGFLFVLGFLPSVLIFVNNANVSGLILFIYIVLLFSFLLINHKRIDFTDLSLTFMISIMLTFFMKHLCLVAELSGIGRLAVWIVFVGACMSDTFAYFCGMEFGKNKLAPNISPKKTIEGSIGAVAGSVLSLIVYGFILWLCFGLNVNFWLMIVLGILCSVFGQLGDLSASIIKREYGIKDFGTIFPGHGGMLDRFDSILFVAPIVYYFITMFQVIFI